MFRTKLVGFMLSAAMTSLAAVLYMQFYMAIDPEAAFGLSQAIQLQLPALLGGLGTALGPIIGGAVMIFLSEVTNWGSTKIGIEGLDILVYGLMLLVVILRAPTGIVGWYSRTRCGRLASERERRARARGRKASPAISAAWWRCATSRSRCARAR